MTATTRSPSTILVKDRSQIQPEAAGDDLLTISVRLRLTRAGLDLGCGGGDVPARSSPAASVKASRATVTAPATSAAATASATVTRTWSGLRRCSEAIPAPVMAGSAG
jgi:hypothetical protein